VDRITIQAAQLLKTSTDQLQMLKGTFKLAFASRRETRKKLRRELTESFKAQKLDEHKKNPKAIKTGLNATHSHRVQ